MNDNTGKENVGNSSREQQMMAVTDEEEHW
jgi:hypothetical protein